MISSYREYQRRESGGLGFPLFYSASGLLTISLAPNWLFVLLGAAMLFLALHKVLEGS
jgi:hypothetical protein